MRTRLRSLKAATVFTNTGYILKVKILWAVIKAASQRTFLNNKDLQFMIQKLDKHYLKWNEQILERTQNYIKLKIYCAHMMRRMGVRVTWWFEISFKCGNVMDWITKMCLSANMDYVKKSMLSLFTKFKFINLKHRWSEILIKLA